METIDALKLLREETGCGWDEARACLSRAEGDLWLAQGFQKYQGLAVMIRKPGMTPETAYSAWVEANAHAFAERKEVETGTRPKVC